MKLLKQIILIVLFLVFVSCGKEFLDIKQNANQDVPSTIQDYQAILDRTNIMNIPSLDLAYIAAEEFYVKNKQLLLAIYRFAKYHVNAYQWKNDPYEGDEGIDWNLSYQRILYANMALDVDKVTPTISEQKAWDNVKGSALFHRAWNYYQLAQLFCKPYDKATAQHDLGVPLRLDYDVSVKYDRGTVQQVYDQILSDLFEAEVLLPNKPESSFRPSKAAVYSLLARTYLQMNDYENAWIFANKGLDINSKLIDFNNLSTNIGGVYESAFLRYGEGNPAIIFSAIKDIGGAMESDRFDVDSSLLNLYDTDDLRKDIFFFKGSNDITTFIGSYNGMGHQSFFCGFTVEELLLIRAECSVRKGRLVEAMNDVNYLLENRYRSGSFITVKASNEEEALNLIFLERRKELYMRGVRWEDLRRLNKEDRFAVKLVRKLDSERYELPPNDPRWVWPLPDKEIDFKSIL